MAISRPVWTIQQDPVSKDERRKRRRKRRRRRRRRRRKREKEISKA
jgi:hypothetical protein